MISEETRQKLKQYHKNNPNKYWLGKKMSDEHKKKISESNKGKHNKKGYKHTEEAKKKISFHSTKENNPNWKGGITPLHQKERDTVAYKIWRTTVFQKDNYTCQKCNQKGGYLEAHHIENFHTNIELRILLSNGITFCKVCHRKFHSIYGNKNTIEQLNQFLIN